MAFNPDDGWSDGEDGAPAPEIPLITAAKACDLDALRRALAAGEDVNYRDGEGHCALHYLCCCLQDTRGGARKKQEVEERRLACVLELIARGADVNLRRARDFVHHILPFWADVGGH
jgi:ankyrin repeat protein